MATDIIARGIAAGKADLVDGKVPVSQLPSYVDDVIEYDSTDNFPEQGERGKIYVALDTGFTYRWSGTEYIQIGGQDLSNFVTLDSAQTITGVKTFSNGALFSSIGASDNRPTNTYLNILNATYLEGGLNCRTSLKTFNAGHQNIDVGQTDRPFRDLVIWNVIRSDNNANYGLALPDTTNYTANKTLATTDQALNVINASDITDNTLTDAQYTLITNGKPTLISGTLLGYTNPLILSLEDFTTTLRGFMFTGRTLRGVMITVSSKTISDGENDLRFDKVNMINGKVVPAYPSSTGTFGFKCIDGTLSWEEKIKEDFSSQISLDNESSLTILRKECYLIKEGSSVKMHIYISGKNESGAAVTGVRFSSNSTFTVSSSAIAGAIKDMNNNAISTNNSAQIKSVIQNWYNDGNTVLQTLRMSHNGENSIYLYSVGYSASIPDNANFILSIDEVLAV